MVKAWPSQTGFSCGDATLLVVEESAQESQPLKRSGWLVDDDILGGSGVKLPKFKKSELEEGGSELCVEGTALAVDVEVGLRKSPKRSGPDRP